MFQRRTPLSLIQKLKEFFWPTMGWKRSYLYAKHRLLRLADSTHKIALGLAIGCAVSFTPLVGTHFIQAGVFAYLLRGNILAAMIGTFVGNPSTFPFMWGIAIGLGSFLFGMIGLPADSTLPEHVSLGVLWDLLLHDPLRILLPWLVGGYVAMFLSIPLSYVIFYRLVHGAKVARAKARLAKVRRVAREMTQVK